MVVDSSLHDHELLNGARGNGGPYRRLCEEASPEQLPYVSRIMAAAAAQDLNKNHHLQPVDAEERHVILTSNRKWQG